MFLKKVLLSSAMMIVLTLSGAMFLCPARAASAVYDNKTMGLTFISPDGWLQTPGEVFQGMVTKTIDDVTKTPDQSAQRLGILTVFSAYPLDTKNKSNPSITVVAELISALSSESKLDYARKYLNTINAMGTSMKVIKKPKKVTINKSEGVTFTYESAVSMGTLEIKLKYLVYIFFKNNISFTISCADKAETFNKNARLFESSVKTFNLR
ncbi:MAG: hypothetical protein WC695_09625 [Candidatus Omnitrophota bacterium]